MTRGGVRGVSSRLPLNLKVRLGSSLLARLDALLPLTGDRYARAPDGLSSRSQFVRAAVKQLVDKEEAFYRAGLVLGGKKDAQIVKQKQELEE